jgi:hypothetical protein
MIGPKGYPVVPSGQVLDLADPSSMIVTDLDLRTGITNGTRYAGQLDVSILAHLGLCVLLGRVHGLDTLELAHVAAHDLHEAYTGDLIFVWKRLVPAIVDIENPWHAHVLDALGLDEPIPAAVKRIDLRAVAVEAVTWEHPHAEHHMAHHGGELDDRELHAGRVARRMSECDSGRDLLWGLIVEAVANHVGEWRLPADLPVVARKAVAS